MLKKYENDMDLPLGAFVMDYGCFLNELGAFYMNYRCI